MEEEKKEETKTEDTPSTEKSITDSLNGIKDALYILLFITLLGQCSQPFAGESKEAKRLGEIASELRMIHEAVASDRDAARSIDASLREIVTRLSQINGTIWDKSCSK